MKWAQIDRTTGAVQLVDYPLASDHPALHPETGHIDQRAIETPLDPADAVRFDRGAFVKAPPIARTGPSAGDWKRIAAAAAYDHELEDHLAKVLARATELRVIGPTISEEDR